MSVHREQRHYGENLHSLKYEIKMWKNNQWWRYAKQC